MAKDSGKGCFREINAAAGTAVSRRHFLKKTALLSVGSSAGIPSILLSKVTGRGNPCSRIALGMIRFGRQSQDFRADCGVAKGSNFFAKCAKVWHIVFGAVRFGLMTT